MSHAHLSIPPPARSWTEIPQEIAPRAMSAAGRRRAAFSMCKLILVSALIGTTIWAGIEIYMTWRHDPRRLADPTQSSPLRTIALQHTNGVLTRDWLVETLAIRPGSTLMGLDLEALKARLLANGQVRNAILTRQFPDTLAVTLDERTPVIRILVQDESGQPLHAVVSQDGTVYRGINYDPALISSLPWLDGVGLRRLSGETFAPVAGIDSVARLLEDTRTWTPALAPEFSIVSLVRYADDGILTVNTTRGEQFLFGTSDDFFRQLARLDYILEQARQAPDARPLQSVNLALGRQVPIRFQAPPAPAPAAPAPRRAVARQQPATAPQPQPEPALRQVVIPAPPAETGTPARTPPQQQQPQQQAPAGRLLPPTRPGAQPQTQTSVLPRIAFHI
ncbi:cell division septal protein [Opitutaceae bacterium TAV1]|nr:cell division septal protein [Opitutaceae bacterium TAV1]